MQRKNLFLLVLFLFLQVVYAQGQEETSINGMVLSLDGQPLSGASVKAESLNISTKTDYIRQLTATGENLYPRFAKDPDTIMFIKQYQNQSALGIVRLNANKTYHFPLKTGKLQSIDW